MNATIIYVPNFIINSDEALASLRDELNWERRDDAPRCEYYCNDIEVPYAYGRNTGRRTYEPRPYHPTIIRIKNQVEEFCRVKLEACFLNKYLNQSDHLGWHADDSEEMDDSRPIVSVSLGVERELWFRPNTDTKAIEKKKLEHGSICVMLPGMQDTWQHRIPKAGFMCGVRVSLTFRGYINPNI